MAIRYLAYKDATVRPILLTGKKGIILLMGAFFPNTNHSTLYAPIYCGVCPSFLIAIEFCYKYPKTNTQRLALLINEAINHL
jgi:hypothetical protein